MVSPVMTMLQSDSRADIARQNFLDFLTLVGVHLHQTADAFLACPC